MGKLHREVSNPDAVTEFSPWNERRAVIDSLVEVQERLRALEQERAAVMAERDSHILLALDTGWRHSEIAQRAGIGATTVANAVRRSGRSPQE